MEALRAGLLSRCLLGLIIVLWSVSLKQSATPLATHKIRPLNSEIKCLAATLHFEARGQGLYGQILVGSVVINRMRHYNKSACEVVKQKNQFQWFTVHRKIPSVGRYTEKLAEEILMDHHTGRYRDKTKGSLYFVTKDMYPTLNWTKPVKVIHKDHVFF